MSETDQTCRTLGPSLSALMKEYRPSMSGDVLKAWAADVHNALAAGKVVSREEVEHALEKAGAYRRKQTLWLVTTKEATDAVRALMKGRTAPPADPAKAATTCWQHRPGSPCPTPASCWSNGCSAVEREIFPDEPAKSSEPDLYAHLLDMLGVATHEEAGAEIGRLHGIAYGKASSSAPDGFLRDFNPTETNAFCPLLPGESVPDGCVPVYLQRTATPPASAPQSDEVLIAIKRGEAYEDVHPQLVAEDALRQTLHGGCQFEWRVVDVATPPASASEVTQEGKSHG